MRRNERKLLGFIKRKCKENGVTLKLVNKKFINLSDEGTKCSGYFDSDSKKIFVSMKRDDWYEILAHEYCHSCQWLEKLPFDWDSQMSVDADEFIWQPLTQKRVDSRRLFEQACVSYQWIELDCEMRAIELLTEYGLLVEDEIVEYIKGANAYLFFYTYYKRNRKWMNKKRPYDVPEIVEMMPEEFLELDGYRRCPYGYVKLFEEKCV